MKKVSIIVPVYNGKTTIGACVESLLNLDLGDYSAEIITVDNNSTDGTKEIIQKYNVKYYFEETKGRAFARNRGIKESSGDFVAFIDADCVAEKGWLVRLLSGFTVDNIAVCGGKSISADSKTIFQEYLRNEYIESNCKELFYSRIIIPLASTCNVAYRRNIFDVVGCFDSTFIAGEDLDISSRIYLAGYDIAHVDNAVVFRSYHSDFSSFCKNSFEGGYAKILLESKYDVLFKITKAKKENARILFKETVAYFKVFMSGLFKKKSRFEAARPMLTLLRNFLICLGACSALIKLKLKVIRINQFIVKKKGNVIGFLGNKRVVFNFEDYSVHGINDVGERILEMLNADVNHGHIIDALCKEYMVDRDMAREDVENFASHLKLEKLIV